MLVIFLIVCTFIDTLRWEKVGMRGMELIGEAYLGPWPDSLEYVTVIVKWST